MLQSCCFFIIAICSLYVSNVRGMVEENPATSLNVLDANKPSETRTKVRLESYFDNGENLTTNTNNTSIDEFLETLEGVDPNEPEEIARKEFYKKNMNMFEHILHVNHHVHQDTNIFQGDVKQSGFRNAGGGRVWPKTRSGSSKGLVRIPYTISSKYTKEQKNVIQEALNTYKSYTCIRFIPRTNQREYIHVQDSRGCWSYVGRIGAPKQTVSLGVPGCVHKGIALHELMHALGFQHEQSRSDRDDYVRVLRDNLEGGWNSNYAKLEYTRNLVIYDYGSVMHYGRHAFSKQPYLPAMVVYPERNPKPAFGQRQRLSPYDIEEIKYLYNCESGTYPRCGRDFVNKQKGTFQSPSYPKAYAAGAHCTWSITVKPGRFIEITFTNVDLPKSTLCQSDAILIHDGSNAAAPVLKRICEKNKRLVVTGTRSKIFIIFSSDDSDNSFTGFRASFKEVTEKPSNGNRAPAHKIPVPTIPPINKPVSRFDCNFDRNLCGMKQDRTDDLDFTRHSGRTSTPNTGPTRDHTSGSGYYIYAESSLPANVGDMAVVRTPWFRKSSSNCVSFYYHMYGTYMGGLRLFAFEKHTGNNVGKSVKIWEKLGNQKNSWNNARITYRPRSNVQYVQFYWKAYVYFYLSDIALDDIAITTGNCGSQPSKPKPTNKPPASRRPTTKPVVRPPPIGVRTIPSAQCNFESNFCQFTQSTADVFDWRRLSGTTPTQGTGPDSDHTSEKGTYAYAEASAPRRRGHKAILESPYLTPTEHCLTMWYHMNGRHMGELSIIQEIDGTGSTLKKFAGTQGTQWNKLTLELNSVKAAKRNVRVLIEATIGVGVLGDIAIDDIEITNARCASVATAAPRTLPNQFSCDFETSLCGIQQLKSDDFDWVRNKGTTASSRTGPSTDNTKKTNAGYYLYVEASTARLNDVGKLLLPKLRPGRYCVRFAYHMYGVNMGKLGVFALEGSSNTPINQWKEEGNQGNQWLSASIDYYSGSSTNPVQFMFQSEVGAGFSSDAALDDINIQAGRCTGATTQKPRTTPKTVRPTAVPQSVSSTFACNFESSNLCGMTQAKSDNFDWIRHSGSTPSRHTGPFGDHTSGQNGKGHYLYMEASGKTRNHSTTVLTPTFTANSQKRCLVFWYHMRGRTMGTLNVFAEYRLSLRTGVNRNQLIFTDTGNKGSSWRAAKIEMNFNSAYIRGSMRVKFQGVVGRTSSSDIAIDDICTAEGPCASSQCSTSGVLTKTTVAPTTVTTTTTTAATTTPRVTTFIRPAPETGSTVYAGMPMCTFDDKASKPVGRTVAPSQIPGDSSRDIGGYTYSDAINNSPLCGFFQFRNYDNFDWSRTNSKTSTAGTGPTGDKTSGKGHYMYIESSSKSENDKAFLQTYAMPAYDYCVKFSYHMQGAATGRLNIRTIQTMQSDKKMRPLIHEIIGNQGSRWFETSLDFSSPRNGKDVAFRFEGVVGNGFTGDIAIDDVMISPGRCNSCRTPSQSFGAKKFSTGCVHTGLFWVRCCDSQKDKVVYRRVRQCQPNMFQSVRLNWYCNNL